MENSAVLKPGESWKEYFYGQADEALHRCTAYQQLVKLLLDGAPEETVAEQFRVIGLSGNERVGLRTCVHNYTEALASAPAFAELNKKWMALEARVQAAAEHLHGEILSEDDRDAGEAELQRLLHEQESLRTPWTRSKLAREFLPGLRMALGLDQDRPEAGKH